MIACKSEGHGSLRRALVALSGKVCGVTRHVSGFGIRRPGVPRSQVGRRWLAMRAKGAKQGRSLDICIHTYIYIYIHVHVGTCIYMCVCVCVFCVCVFVGVPIRPYSFEFVHLCIRAYV